MSGLPALFHYTCVDAAEKIRACNGVLKPAHDLFLPEPVIWLTDLDGPPRAALFGANSRLLCDRLAVVFRADPERLEAVERWSQYARRLPAMVRAMYEAAPGLMPAHWWVSTRPVPTLDGAA